MSLADDNRTGVSSHDIARQVIISGEKLEAAQTTVNEMEKLLHVSDVLVYGTYTDVADVPDCPGQTSRLLEP
jgi:hypothetical protein